jgi:hypothetical protein
MAKKTKNRSKRVCKPVKKAADEVQATVTAEEYLEIKIRFSKNAITDRSGYINEFFVQQTERLERELKALKETK